MSNYIYRAFFGCPNQQKSSSCPQYKNGLPNLVRYCKSSVNSSGFSKLRGPQLSGPHQTQWLQQDPHTGQPLPGPPGRAQCVAMGQIFSIKNNQLHWLNAVYQAPGSHNFCESPYFHSNRRWFAMGNWIDGARPRVSPKSCCSVSSLVEPKVLLMVQKSQTTTRDVYNLVNNGINYQPQLVQDFWTINSITVSPSDFVPGYGLPGLDGNPMGGSLGRRKLLELDSFLLDTFRKRSVPKSPWFFEFSSDEFLPFQ